MADFASEADRIGAIQSLVDNVGWQRWMQPLLTHHLSRTMKILAKEHSDNDDVNRGWIQALNWILSLPAQEIEAFKNAEREVSKHADTQREDEYRSYFGYRSPYKRAPEAGETKLADDTTSAA